MLKKMIIILLFGLALSAGATALSDLVATMNAGDWRTLETNNIVPVLGQNMPGGSSGNVLPYANDIAWDPGTRALYFIGSDHQHATGYARFAAYAESTNTWTELPRPAWFQPLTETAMHGYDHTAIDPATGILYHTPFRKNGGGSRYIHRYDTRTAAWLSSILIGVNTACCIGFEYFPERQSLIFVDPGIANNIYERSLTGMTPVVLGTGLAMGGYHNMAEYNPVHKVVIGGGGNGSNALHKVDPSGTVTTLRNAPFAYRILTHVLTVDPAGGDYLMFTSDRQFYAYNVLTDTWTLQGGTVPIYTSSSDGATFSVVATPVSTYGVTLFVSCNGTSDCWVSVYKRTAGTAAESAPVLSGHPGLHVSPNPVTDRARVRVLGFAPKRARVFDAGGRLAASFGIHMTDAGAASSEFTWDAGRLPVGLYVMSVEGQGKRATRKIFVRK